MDTKFELKQVGSILLNAYSGIELVTKDQKLNHAQLDHLLELTERAVIRLRTLTESIRPRQSESIHKPTAPIVSEVIGNIKVNEFGWLHITLNSLLPNCKYKTPTYLQNTLTMLLTNFQKGGRKLPFFERAMLIIEEHCNIKSRQVFDQDNKGWKVIPNALKGLVIPDDDQFTLEVALLSKQSDSACCHIYLLPAEDAGEYFSVRSGNYGVTF